MYRWLHSGYTATDKKKGQPVKVGLSSLETRMHAGFALMVPGAGLEPARLAAGDFESPESTNFTTRAVFVKTQIMAHFWVLFLAFLGLGKKILGCEGAAK